MTENPTLGGTHFMGVRLRRPTPRRLALALLLASLTTVFMWGFVYVVAGTLPPLVAGTAVLVSLIGTLSHTIGFNQDDNPGFLPALIVINILIALVLTSAAWFSGLLQ